VSGRTALALRILCLGGLLLATVAWAAGKNDAQLGQKRKELQQLEQQLKENRQRVEGFRQQEQGLLGTLEQMELGVQQQVRLLGILAQREELLASDVEELQQQAGRLEEEVGLRRTLLDRRIRHLYIHGRPQSALMLVQAAQRGVDPGKLYLWGRLLTSDRRLIDDLRQALTARRAQALALQERLAEVKQVRERRARERVALEGKRTESSQALERVRGDRQLLEQAVQEVEANQQILLKVIAQLEKARQREKVASKGKTPRPAERPTLPADRCWPVNGPVVVEFGLHRHPKLQTLTRNLGVEMGAPAGTVVRSAAAGVVAEITPFPGKGLGMIVDHGGGQYTVYAHLAEARVRKGARVRACQELATVGEVGSLAGSTLFFQVAVGQDGVDPVVWLQGATQGR